MLRNHVNPMNGLLQKSSILSLLLVASSLVATQAYAQVPAPAEEAPAPAAESSEPKAAEGASEEVVEAAPESPTPSAEVIQQAATTATPASEKKDSSAASAKKEAKKTKGGKEGEVVVLENPLEEQLAEYWSTEGRDLASLSERLYTRDGRFEMGLYVALQPSSPYWIYVAPGLQLTYNFSNYYGLEFSGSYSIGFPSELGRFAKQHALSDLGKNNEKLSDKMIMRSDLAFIWRPFYGKFGFFNKKLAHFDVNFATGLGVNAVHRADKTHSKVELAVEPELLFGAGFALLFHPDWTVRVDFRGYLTRGPETITNDTYFKRLDFPVEFSLGASYLF